MDAVDHLMFIHLIHVRCQAIKVNNHLFPFLFISTGTLELKKFTENHNEIIINENTRHAFNFLVLFVQYIVYFSNVSAVDFSLCKLHFAIFSDSAFTFIIRWLIHFFPPKNIHRSLSRLLLFIRWCVLAPFLHSHGSQVLHKVLCYPCGSSQCVHVCVCASICVYIVCFVCTLRIESSNVLSMKRKKNWNKSWNKEKMLRTQFLHIHAALLTFNTRATHLYIHTHTFSTHTMMKWQGIFHTLYIIFLFFSCLCVCVSLLL